MWPSPETRWPIRKPRTSSPIASTVRTYSWPTVIGTGIVFCAQSSQLKMCMSVPQIAVLRMRISTSLGPTAGLGPSVIQMPGSRRALASVLMRQVYRVFVALPCDAELPADLRERRDGALDVLRLVRRGHLRADARLAARHDREREADHV